MNKLKKVAQWLNNQFFGLLGIAWFLLAIYKQVNDLPIDCLILICLSTVCICTDVILESIRKGKK